MSLIITKTQNWTQQPHPMFKASNIHYEFDGRHQGISYGGIGLIHLLARNIGLFKEIDKNVDGTISETYRQYKQGMDISYNGKWGYAPLIISLAGQIPESKWELLQREPRKIKTRHRRKPENVKARVVRKRKFRNLKTEYEHISEFEYKPGKCQKPYRMVALRKTIKVLKGQCRLFDEIRYFFYITNDDKKSTE